MSRSPCAKLAFVIPGAAVLLGILTVFAYDRPESDWGLFSAFGGLFKLVLIGAIASLILSILAFARRETKAMSTLIVSLPSLLLVVWAGVGYSQVTKERERRREEDQSWKYHSERLSSKKGLLEAESWPNDGSPRGRALRGALWNGTGNFDEADLQALYDADPTWIDAICYHPECPEHLLGRRFVHYVESSKRPGVGGSFLRILSHPKSPVEFIEEVSQWEDLSETDKWALDRVLQGKLQKQGEDSTPEQEN